MNFYKLVDGNLIDAPKRYIHHNGLVYTNPTYDIYLKFGYKPLHEDEKPEIKEGFYLVAKYEEHDDFIKGVWVYDPIPDEILENNVPDINVGDISDEEIEQEVNIDD